MEIARAVILAAASPDEPGWCSVGAAPKPLVSIATKPVVIHVLEALGAAGIRDAVIVTDGESVPKFRAEIGQGADWGISVAYAEASPGADMCGALEAAQGFVDGGPVVVHQADGLIGDRLRGALARFACDDVDVLTLTVSRAGTPDPPINEAACWLLSARAVSGLLQGGPRPEDPLLGLRSRGARVHSLEVEGCLACHGAEASLLSANRQVLAQLRPDFTAAVLYESEIQGAVVIHPTALLQRALVRGPAIIGPGARLIDTYVGPYTSIGANARLVGAEIEHSIVMSDVELLNVGTRVETSIIGRGASIVRRFDMPRAVRLSIGDGAAIALS